MPIGILIGLSLGALGGGGSILTVPALVYLLGLNLHSATTASLIIVGTTSLAGMSEHLRCGRVRLRAGIVFGVLGAGGAFIGSRLSAAVNPQLLLTAFSVLMEGAAVTMLLRQRPGARPRSRSATDGRPTVKVSPLTARVVLSATAVGLVTGFFGVGGGFVVVPALVLACGFDMPTAVGTSLFVITINSVSSLLSRIGTHVAIDPGLLGIFTASAIAGALVGTRVTSKVRSERLAGAFGILMTAVALYTVARSLPALI